MTLTLIILIQITFLLAAGIGISVAIRSNPTRSHRVLIAALICVLPLPALSYVVFQLRWGILPARVATEEPERDLSSPTMPRLVVDMERRGTQPNFDVMEGEPSLTSIALEYDVDNVDAEIVAPSAVPRRGHSKPIRASTAVREPTRSVFPQVGWRRLLLVTWAMWSLVALLRMVFGYASSMKLFRGSRELEQSLEIQSALLTARSDLNIDGHIGLYESASVSCPVIWSWGQPRIIIPAGSAKLESIEWRSVFTHELAHLRRGDHWSSLFAESVRCLLPWHPLVIYSCRRLYRLSELACDAWAVKYCSAESFAESLISFTPAKRPFAVSAMSSKGSDLHFRVKRLLSGKAQAPAENSLSGRMVVPAALMVLVLTALLQTHAQAPQAETAQQATTEKPGQEAKAQSAILRKTEQPKSQWTDEEWIERLVAIPASAPWGVGANMGSELRNLQGKGRGYRILSACWDRIDVDARKQILKGFHDTRIHPDFFRVMHLGMRSDIAGLRRFASTYLEDVLQRNFRNDPDGYRLWYATTDGLDALEVASAEIRSLVDQAKDPKTRDVRRFLDRIGEKRRMLVLNRPLRKALLTSGVEDLLQQWKEAGYIENDHEVLKIVADIRASEQEPRDVASGKTPKVTASDEVWTTYLTSISDGSQWYVGARSGNTMSRMKGDRAYNILNGCWNEISANTRCQILKGFTPGFSIKEINPRYLDILALGYRSKEPRVREFASTYLKSDVLREFSSLDEFNRWHEDNVGKSYEEIMRPVCTRMIDECRTADEIEAPALLSKIYEGIGSNEQLKSFCVEAGLVDILKQRLRDGKVRLGDRVAIPLLEESSPPDFLHDLRQATLKELINTYERYAKSGRRYSQFDFSNLAQSLSNDGYTLAIPTMIGIIDADNDSSTVYGVGYFGLSKMTGVPYMKTHDGAWWRRWWETNKATFPEEVRQMEIPSFTKSVHGSTYVPFPESMESLDGKLAWLIERQQAGLDYEVALDTIAYHQPEPRAIPILIGMLDADNSDDAIHDIGRCLRKLTGAKQNRLSDGPWWRRWWQKNKSRYPADVQEIAIPDLPKTDHGKTYVPILEGLDTVDGKIKWLAGGNVDARMFARILVSRDERPSADEIPKLIGILDCDNSEQTIQYVGRRLHSVTGVRPSPLHDGSWWRRWWESNKETYPEAARQLPIPDLPKTRHGQSHQPYPNLDSLDEMIAYLNREDCDDEIRSNIYTRVGTRTDWKDPDIPKLIGILDSDNSEATMLIGRYSLQNVTEVKQSDLHDGPWWRRWWQRNKTRYSAEAQKTSIPNVRKTAAGETYQPFSASLDTTEGRIAWVKDGCPSPRAITESDVLRTLCEDHDPRVIPILIGWMLATNSTIESHLVRNDLAEMGVLVSAKHSPLQWKSWWNNNKERFPKAASEIPIPNLTSAVQEFRARSKARLKKALDRQFPDMPSVQHTIGADDKMSYFQIGPSIRRASPTSGWKVLLILPGGSGNANFNPFCRTIQSHALPDDYLAIQMVAPVWSDDENRVVWPTAKLNPQKGTFTTEEFIRAVVEDVGTRVKIDAKHVYALGWSSGGPAVYANSIVDDSPITGSFVAMSVFHPKQMMNLDKAKGHRYYILHSPEDWIRIDKHAKQAVSTLAEHGAITKLTEYLGGHGWQDEPLKHIRLGIEWLEENAPNTNR